MEIITNILMVDPADHYRDKIIAVVNGLAQQIDYCNILVAGTVIEFGRPVYVQVIGDENSEEA